MTATHLPLTRPGCPGTWTWTRDGWTAWTDPPPGPPIGVPWTGDPPRGTTHVTPRGAWGEVRTAVTAWGDVTQDLCVPALQLTLTLLGPGRGRVHTPWHRGERLTVATHPGEDGLWHAALETWSGARVHGRDIAAAMRVAIEVHERPMVIGGVRVLPQLPMIDTGTPEALSVYALPSECRVAPRPTYVPAHAGGRAATYPGTVLSTARGRLIAPLLASATLLDGRQLTLEVVVTPQGTVVQRLHHPGLPAAAIITEGTLTVQGRAGTVLVPAVPLTDQLQPLRALVDHALDADTAEAWRALHASAGGVLDAAALATRLAATVEGR